MTKFLNSTLGVTGASGHLGRRVVELLVAAGAKKIVATTRDPGKLADLAGRGVDVRRASFDEPGSLAAAFAGIDRLLLISTDDVATRLPHQIAAIDAAEAAGIGHIAYTGVTSPYPDPAAFVPDSHFWTEARLIAGGTDWSFLRNNLYADYQIPVAQHAIASGVLYHAAQAGRRAFVTREDCAAAAAGALLKVDGKRIFDVSGPEALSADDLAGIFARLAGKAVEARNIPAAALKAGLVEAGVPAAMASVLERFDSDAAEGRLGVVTGAVEELTGRRPQSLQDFLAANRPALAA